MSNHSPLLVDISFEAAPAPWKANGNLSFTGNKVTIHLKDDHTEQLSSVRKAARKLGGLCNEVALGDNWSKELSIAFITSYKNPTGKQHVTLATGNDTSDLENYLIAHQFTVDLINETPQNLPPMELAHKTAHWLTELEPDAIKFQIISGKELQEQQWHGIYEVGRGSDRPPAMLDLDFNPTGDADAPTKSVLVGKGITFDSGGYSIKTSQGMVAMKCDMGGAATVTGALGLAIMQGLTNRTRLILCCAENLISGHAYKLGDIITYKNGTTVEIVNTDAEGRLVLADGLMRAAEFEPEQIIDAATLTGAAVVALGSNYNALFALDKAMTTKAQAAANKVNEPAWPLPLEPFHQYNCPSPYADTANSRPQKGGGSGGASNAAGFLSRFVPNNGKGWLHMDLAAAFNDSSSGSRPAGATAQGIRTIAELIK